MVVLIGRPKHSQCLDRLSCTHLTTTVDLIAFRLVVFLTGLAHVTLPANSSSDAWIVGGSAASLVVAADTTGGGHITTYPSDETTLSLQIPLEGDGLLPHKVIGNEACHGTSQVVSGKV